MSGLTKEQIDSMVRESDATAGMFDEHSLVGNMAFHIKALASEVEELRHLGEDDANWRQHLRDFVEDGEQHAISRDEWILNRGNGIVLYAVGGFFAAYFDDAGVVWEESSDDLPMHHVMVKSDPPHRAAIHRRHLADWIEHLATHCIPVEIMTAE